MIQEKSKVHNEFAKKLNFVGIKFSVKVTDIHKIIQK